MFWVGIALSGIVAVMDFIKGTKGKWELCKFCLFIVGIIVTIVSYLSDTATINFLKFTAIMSMGGMQ